MIPSTLFAFVAAISSLVAVNGAVVQRDGSFTYLTPQPTSAPQGAGTPATTPTGSQSTSLTFSQPATSNTYSTPSTTAPQSSNVTPTPSKTPPTASTTPASIVPSSIPSSIPTTATTPTVVTSPKVSKVTPTPSSPVTSPSPGTGAGNCDGVQQWQASFAYTAGDRVIFNNQLFTARQWTYNNAPPAHADQWTADGTCTPPINNQANCKGIASWQSTVPYTTGSRVTFNGHLWSAVQWVQSNSPGDTSGSWQDLGACA